MFVYGIKLSRGEDMIESLLKQRGRRLTWDQWETVKQSVFVEPTVLYIQLALRVVTPCASSDKLELPGISRKKNLYC